MKEENVRILYGIMELEGDRDGIGLLEELTKRLGIIAEEYFFPGDAA